MTADSDLYGISGEQCGNDEKFGEEEIGRVLSVFSLANSMFGHTDTEPEYDHEEIDSQEFQEQYRAARLAEELAYPDQSKTYEDKRRFFPTNMPYRVYEKCLTPT